MRITGRIIYCYSLHLMSRKPHYITFNTLIPVCIAFLVLIVIIMTNDERKTSDYTSYFSPEGARC